MTAVARAVSQIRERLIESFGAKAYARLARRGFREYTLRRDINFGRGLLEESLRLLSRAIDPPPGVRDKFYVFDATERSIELPFVRQRLSSLPIPSRILEFGPGVSGLAYELARAGHRVTTVDLRRYPYRHTNLQSTTTDFLEAPIEPQSFDCVYAISAIEHVGLAQYGKGPREAGDAGDRDIEVVGKVYDILRPGGRFVLTIPFGIKGRAESYRVYDQIALGKLLRPFTSEESLYYRKVSPALWVPIDAQSLEKVDSITAGETRGVALLNCLRALPKCSNNKPRA